MSLDCDFSYISIIHEGLIASNQQLQLYLTISYPQICLLKFKPKTHIISMLSTGAGAVLALTGGIGPALNRYSTHFVHEL